MTFLHLVRTVHAPVTALGQDIKNSFGVTIATATDSFIATAIAALINHGVPAATQEELRYEGQQDSLRDILNQRAKKGE